jgi:hypothetical protein
MIKIIYITLLVFFLDASATELIRFNSSQSMQRLSRSKHKVDFFSLSNYFIAQPNGVVCGPTTISIILNALKKENKPKTAMAKELMSNIPTKWDPRFERFTPMNVFNTETDKIKTMAQVYGEPIEGKKDFGLQLRQLHKMFLAHKVKSEIHVINDKTDLKKLKEKMIKNLKEKDDYIVINYSRKPLGQKGGGHISPLVAYEEKTDSFLIMDVNPNKDQWVWVQFTDLIKAMNTFDTIENRGLLFVSK